MAGKQTPRQKMIGMMYLVLTALLALNVQKEVLNAFVIVDNGLTKMNENYEVNNKDLYTTLKLATETKPAVGKKFWHIAEEVKKQADTLYDIIQRDKVAIVHLSEGKKTDAITIIKGEKGEKIEKIDPMLINGKENMDKPSQLMITQGKGRELKEKIDAFRKYLLDNIDKKSVNTRKSIEKGLNTEPQRKLGSAETWETSNFEHLPLVGVTTILSGLQANVRNAESDMIRYKLSIFEKGTFKFTDIDAIVLRNSNYIIRGTNYQAKIFLAASDPNQNPDILIGPVDSTFNKEDGSWTFKKKEGVIYDTTVPIVRGKGIYEKPGTAVGRYKWSGLIGLKDPNGGEEIWKPFFEEYQVAEPMLVVSPTKMNVFYIGVDNPVDISVPGVPADKIFPGIDNGMIKQVGKGSYIVNPSRAGQNANVSVLAEIDKVKKNMGTKTFRVRIVPDPVATVYGIKGSGPIERNILLAQTGVVAAMENFEFDLTFKVTEFTVSTVVGGFTTDKSVKSNRFSAEQMNLIKQTSKGQKVYVEGIRAVGPDGTTRQLGSIALTIK